MWERRAVERHDRIGAASMRGDAEQVASLGAAYTQTEAELHAAMAAWESLVD